MTKNEIIELIEFVFEASPRSFKPGALSGQEAAAKTISAWTEVLGEFDLPEAKRAVIKHLNTSQYPVSAGDIRFHAARARRARPAVAWMYGEA